MPNDLLERKGNEYDDDSTRWHPSSDDNADSDGLESAYDSPSADDTDLPDGHPSKSNKSLDGDELKGAEANAGKDKPTGSPLGGEEDKVGRGFTGTDAIGAVAASNPTMQAVRNLSSLAKNNKGKSAGIGGVIVSLMLAFFGLSSFNLQHYADNFLKKTNGTANSVLKRRKKSAFNNQMRRITKGIASNVENFNNLKALALDGIEPNFKEGTLKFTGSNGEFDVLNLKAADLDAEVTRFLGKSEAFAAEFGDKIVSNEKLLSEMWGGQTAESFYSRFKITRLVKWLSRAPPEGSSPTAAAADAVKHENDAQRANESATAETKTNTLSEQDAKDPNKVAANDQFNAETVDGANKLTTDSQGYVDRMQADPLATDIPSPLGDAPALANAIEGGSAADIAGAAKGILPEIVAKAGPMIAESAVEYGLPAAQEGCKVKGKLTLVNNTRRTLYAIQLMAIGFDFLTVSSHQRAGLITGKALAKYQLIMGRSDKNTGKSFANSGGVNNLLGNKSVHANKANLGKLSVGFAAAGILASISHFVDSIPGVGSGCGWVNNGWVNFGIAVVGVGAAILSDCASCAASAFANALPIIAVVTVSEIVIQIATPILIKTGAKMVMTGLESGEFLGDAVSSGLGTAFSSMNGAHALMPATVPQFSALKSIGDAENKKEIARMGIFDRYFNRDNTDSLLSQMAVKFLPYSGGSNLAKNVAMLGMRAPQTIASAVSSAFTPPGYASAEGTGSLCEDPQFADNNIATDDFCNPMIALSPKIDPTVAETKLRANGLIDPQGAPLGKFKDHIKQCLSGTPGLMYKFDVKEDGSDNGKTDECLPGHGVAFEGETMKLADVYKIDAPTQNVAWWRKLVGQKAYAATLPIYTGYVTDTDYMTAWMGYIDDARDNSASINGTGPSTPVAGSDTVPLPVGSFQTGFPVPSVDTSQMSCPVSPTISGGSVVKVFATGVGFYNIKLCNVHGYSINAVKAKDFDDMYNAMIAAGFKPVTVNNSGAYVRDGGGGNFRTYDTQAACHARSPDSCAPAGGSNHEKGLAVDTACANTDNSQLYTPWMAGKDRGLPAFTKAVTEHPCLNWLHNNSSKYRLLLQCDGKGSGGGEIAAKTGGCETWHISPTGG